MPVNSGVSGCSAGKLGRSIFIAMALCCLPAWSLPALAESLRVSGFGTLGLAGDDHPKIAAARDITQRPEDLYETDITALLDSRLGIQAEYTLDAVDLVSQLVLRDHVLANADSSLDQLYLRFRPGEQFRIRIGRVNYDAFLLSDHRNVGYAYTWARPPGEFYSWIPIFALDGADADYSFNTAGGRWRLRAQVGAARLHIPAAAGYSFKTRNLRDISVVRETDHWRLKAAHTEFTVGTDPTGLAPLQDGLAQVAAAGMPGVSQEASELRQEIGFKGAKVTYSTLGANYDDGTWLAVAEIGRSTASKAMVPHARMGYVGVGRRIAEWTPYVMWSTSRPGEIRLPQNNWGPYNALLRAPALLTLNSTRIDQSTWSLGARWDFHPRQAVKLQWDQTKIKASGYGAWWRDLSVNDRASRVNLFSINFEFVF